MRRTSGKFDEIVGSPALNVDGSYDVGSATAATARYLGWTLGAHFTFSFRFYLTVVAAPGGTTLVHQMRNGGSSFALGHNLRGDRKLTVVDAAGLSIVSASVLTAGSEYRVEGHGEIRTSTTGKLDWGLYLGDATTPLETPISRTDMNLGTAAAIGHRFGKQGTAFAATLGMAKMDVSDTDAALGPYTADVGSGGSTPVEDPDAFTMRTWNAAANSGAGAWV